MKKKTFKFRGYDVIFDFGNDFMNDMLTQDLVDRLEFQELLNKQVGRIIDQKIRKDKLNKLKRLKYE